VYQTVRIAKLKAELKQHEANHATQWAAAQQDGPYEKGSHPFKEYFLLVYWLLRSELQLWGSTLPSNEESLQVFVNICESLIGEVNRVLHPILSEDKTAKTNPVVKKVSMSRVLSSRSANLNTVAFPTTQSKQALNLRDDLKTHNDRYEDFRGYNLKPSSTCPFPTNAPVCLHDMIPRRDLCRPDVRRESKSSLSLSVMRQAVVAACARSVEYLTGVSSAICVWSAGAL
jgi:hypothetical protein